MVMTSHQIRRQLSLIIERNFEAASNPKGKNHKIHRDIAFLAKAIREISKMYPETLENEVKND